MFFGYKNLRYNGTSLMVSTGSAVFQGRLCPFVLWRIFSCPDQILPVILNFQSFIPPALSLAARQSAREVRQAGLLPRRLQAGNLGMYGIVTLAA
jgi:hypothetical protein